MALAITDRDNPYKTATIPGRVVEERPEEDCVVMDAIARNHTGQPFPVRGEGRIVLVIEADELRYAELLFAHRRG